MKFRSHPTFYKEYKKLSRKLQLKVDDRFKMFGRNHLDPVLDNHKLHGKYSGFRSINITGDYRAIYYMEGSVAIFVHIGTHHQLYGK